MCNTFFHLLPFGEIAELGLVFPLFICYIDKKNETLVSKKIYRKGQKKSMKKVLIGIGLLIACLSIGFLYLASKPSVATNYTEVVETGGAVREKVSRTGQL